ncbi:MAG: hypothetical protein AAFO76_12080, partial [Cyanobacteria bacterium J06607_15]
GNSLRLSHPLALGSVVNRCSEDVSLCQNFFLLIPRLLRVYAADTVSSSDTTSRWRKLRWTLT